LRYLITSLVLLLAVLGRGSSETQPIDVKRFAHAVDVRYNELKSLKAAFVEVYQSPGISRTESGILWLKKPGRMRWEYRLPKEKLFLTDSENAYFYVPGERQARKASLRKIDDIRSPLRYLLGRTKLEKDLEALSFAPDIAPLQAGNIVLRGVPKGLKDSIAEVILEISPVYQIQRIMIQGTDGSTTDFRFAKIEENVMIPDGFFHFTPPQGVKMIEDSQFAQ
jgi:outer membrane lipoprotein carrier protein